MSDLYNCLLVDDEPIAREIIASYLAKVPSFKVIKECRNVPEALAILTTNNIDLVFLDINMPNISGITLAKTLSIKSKIIFTTAHRDFASEAFDMNALDYLVKPISFDRFFKSIQKFLSQVESQKQGSEIEKNSFFVRSDRKMIKINIEEILYVESLGDYVQIFTTQNKIITRESLTHVLDKLPRLRFIRTHRSYVVSKRAVDSFTYEFVEIGKKAIPISRTYKESALKSLQS